MTMTDSLYIAQPLMGIAGVKLSAVVVVSILDHHTRRTEGQDYVIGTLLGYLDETGFLQVRNTFALPFNSGDKVPYVACLTFCSSPYTV